MALQIKMLRRYRHSNEGENAQHGIFLSKLQELLHDEDEWRNNPKLDVNRSSINRGNGSYDYALWCAMRIKNPLDICQFLLEKGASVQVSVPNSQFQTDMLPTTLHKVCVKGNLDLLRLIYDHFPNKERFLELMSMRNYLGQSPCWFAVSKGSYELVEWLIQIGCDLGETDASGKTNLLHAIKCDTPNNVLLLLLQLPCYQRAMEFVNFYQHPLMMTIYLCKHRILQTLCEYLLEDGKIKQWEAELLTRCVGTRRLEPGFFENVNEEGSLPFEITVPIILMSYHPEIIEPFFKRFLNQRTPEVLANLLNKKYVSGESLLHLTYVFGARNLRMPRILHFLLKHGADAQQIRIFTNQLVNKDYDSAAVLLSGGLQLENQRPQTYEKEPLTRVVDENMYFTEHTENCLGFEDQCDFNILNKKLRFANWNELFDYADVDDLFLYVLWASGHEAIVQDYLRTKENDVMVRSTGPWVNGRPSPLVNEMSNCLIDLGARNWFIRGRPKLVGNVPSLSLMCVQHVRKMHPGRICSKMNDLNIPQTVKYDLLLGINYNFS